MALWLAIQLGALLVSIARVPLSASSARPAELDATPLLLAAQLAASALLFPFFTRNTATATAVLATSWPFIVLSAIVSARPSAEIAALEAFVTLWLTSLALWRRALSPSKQFPAVAVAMLLVLAPPIAIYLHADYAAPDPLPLPVLITGPSLWNWLLLTALATAGLVAVLFNNLSTACPHRSSAPRPQPSSPNSRSDIA